MMHKCKEMGWYNVVQFFPYWTRPNFTDCIKKGLGYMIVTVVTGSVMTV
jgi:hypothetical protein